MRTNRYIWLVAYDSANLSPTEEDDVPWDVDRFNGFYESLVSRQVQSHSALQKASLVWHIPPMIEIMGFLGGEL